MLEGVAVYALLILVFLSALLTSWWRREAFVLWILLVVSQFLGLLHEYSFGFAGYFDINAMLGIMYAGGILASCKRFHELRKSRFAIPFLVIILLWLYGMVNPIWNGFSSTYYVIRESKDFINYLAYFAVFLYIRTREEVESSWFFLKCLTIYYVAIEVAGSFSRGYAISYLEYMYRPEEHIFTKIYMPIFTIIVLWFMKVAFDLAITRRPLRKSSSILFYSVGVLLTFFRAYILSSVFAIALILGLSGNIRKSITTFVLIAMILPLSILLLYSNTSESERYEDLFDSFIVSGITELQTHRGGSLSGRDAVTRGRMELAKQRPWTGWGFLNQESEMGEEIRHKVGNTGAGAIGFVDKGYLDVIVKFGIPGGLLLYGLCLFIMIRLIIMSRSVEDTRFKGRSLALAGLVLVFLCVQLTHASLTRQFGILPLALVAGLVDREYLLLAGSGRMV